MLASVAAGAGIRRIHFVAWRDLDDPEAGGSELHAHEVASLVGRGRTRRHLPHLCRPRCARSVDPGRLPGPAPLRALRGVPRRRLGGPAHGTSPGRRPGRDLERDAVPVTPVVPRAAHRVLAPRPRRDVGHGPAAHAGPAGRSDGAPDRTALLPLEPHRDAVRVVAPRDRRDAPPAARPGDGGAARGRLPLHAGRHALAHAPRGGGGTPGAGQALRRAAPGARQGEGGPAGPAGGHRRRGVRAAGARGAARRAGCGRLGEPAGPRGATTSWCRGTGGPGWSRAVRNGRAGA